MRMRVPAQRPRLQALTKCRVDHQESVPNNRGRQASGAFQHQSVDLPSGNAAPLSRGAIQITRAGKSPSRRNWCHRAHRMLEPSLPKGVVLHVAALCIMAAQSSRLWRSWLPGSLRYQALVFLLRWASCILKWVYRAVGIRLLSRGPGSSCCFLEEP